MANEVKPPVRPEGEPLPVKPGVKTTEFWITLLIQILGVAQILGYVTPEEAPAWQGAIANLVTAVWMIASAVMYIWSRIQVKMNR